MIRVGLLSDTHGYIDEKMLKFLTPVDEIWHAGDVGQIAIYDKLTEVHPVRAVYGNIDNNEIRQTIPLEQQFQVEGVKVYMIHIGGYPGHYAPGVTKKLKTLTPKLFISGHSHILKVINDKSLNCLHMNPGAAGIQGFHQVRTMLRFTIDGINIKDLEVWEHPRRP